MRIISGTARGHQLLPPAPGTRPTSDRAREALFSILSHRIDQARVADLYAGSGALGLEALSRGAAHLDLVENNRKALETIRRNLQKTRLQPATLYPCDVPTFLRTRTGAPYDLLLADPPYNHPDSDLFGPLDWSAHLQPQGLLILERASATPPPTLPGLQLIQSRRYGNCSFHFFERET